MKTAQIVTSGVIAAAVVVVVLQERQKSKLEAEVATLRAGTSPGSRLLEFQEPEEDPVTSGGDISTALRAVHDLFEVRDPIARTRALLSFAESLPPEQYAEILKHIRESRPEWDPDAKLVRGILLGKWGATDAEAAFASIEDLPMKDRGGDAVTILSGLASVDVAAAQEWLGDPENDLAQLPLMGHFLAGAVGNQWVRDDPEAALAWASELPVSQRAGAHHGILRTLAATDPARAAEYASSLDSHSDREKLLDKIANSWGLRDPEAALDWASTLEGADRTRVFGQALAGYAENDPEVAASYVDSAANEERQTFIGPVADAFARQDPGGAANWVSGQPEGAGKNDGMRRVIGNWITSDPAAASEWLGEQAPSPSRDQGIVALSYSTFDANPVAAITWANEISDAELRHASVARGLQEYAKRDPEEAATWMAESPVMTPRLWESLAATP